MTVPFNAGQHHKNLIALLRTLEGTKLPVKLRKGAANGPVVTCTIHHVHKHDRIEIASDELARSTQFAESATFFLNLNEIFGLEVVFAVPVEKVVITEEADAGTEAKGASATGRKNGARANAGASA